MGRVLSDLDIVHVALTAMPANPHARVLSAKFAGYGPAGSAAGYAEVITLGQEIEQEYRHRHPDPDVEIADRLLATGCWPGPDTGLPLAMRRELAVRAVDAKWVRERRAPVDPEWQRRRQADRASVHAHVEATKAWEQHNATTSGCGFCNWCRRGAPANCDYR
jgi:hypothetical protein